MIDNAKIAGRNHDGKVPTIVSGTKRISAMAGDKEIHNRPTYLIMEGVLHSIFNPKSVVVIEDDRCIVGGVKPRIYTTNSKKPRIMDETDLAIFTIPVSDIPPVMEECVEKDVKAAIITSKGSPEEIIRIAKKGGIRIIGPNCTGIYGPKIAITSIPIKTGEIAFVSQNEDVDATILTWANEHRLGFSGYVGCGSCADLQIEDFIEYFGRDEQTKVIIAYIEHINDGRMFIDKVSGISAEKPIIALKSGDDTLYDAVFKQLGIIRVDRLEEMLDVAKAFIGLPLPKGRKIGILTGGGGWGVMAADACEDSDLRVADIPSRTMMELNRILPSRWSHGNPVDTAGDTNIAAALKCPEILLRCEEIDALVLMMFIGFSSLTKTGAGMVLPMNIRGMIGMSLNFVKGVDMSTISMFRDMAPMYIKPMIFASFKAMKRIFTRTTHSKMVEIASVFATEFDRENMQMIADLMKEYEKPIVLASLVEKDPEGILASLEEEVGMYIYPTPERAIYAISKLAEYAEFLEKR